LRTAGRLKLGFYPLAQVEAERIRRFLQFSPEMASVLDPCAGAGAALETITRGAVVRRYDMELDAYRACEATRVLDHVIHGGAFETHAAVESFSLCHLNSPFDFEIREAKNQRMERVFLEYVYLAYPVSRAGAGEELTAKAVNFR
jgi:hypothetical protein